MTDSAKTKTRADLMYGVFNLVGEYGTATLASYDGYISIQAQTGDKIGPNGYFPYYGEEFPADRVQELLDLAKELGVNMSYGYNFLEDKDDTPFITFEIRT
jgi:hypothetical protein